jgi:leucyl aminopeptidase
MAHGAVLARDLANERSDEMNPERLEAVALALAAEFPGKFRCTVVKGEEQLREHKLDLLAAVGQAARHGPRYIELEYLGNEQSTDKIAVVGKGITYDTGGLNLKPTGSMYVTY